MIKHIATPKPSTLLLMVALGCSTLLLGCSKEPTEAEIESLIKTELAAATAAMPKLSEDAAMPDSLKSSMQQLQDSMKFEVHSVKKHQCEKSGDAYLCDITLDATMPFTGRQQSTQQARFIKTDAGWQISN